MAETAVSRMRGDLDSKKRQIDRLEKELSSLRGEIDHLQGALSLIEQYEGRTTDPAPVSKFRAKGVQATVLKILTKAGSGGIKRNAIIEQVRQSLGEEISAKSVSNALVNLSRKEKVEKLGRGMWRLREVPFDFEGIVSREADRSFARVEGSAPSGLRF